MHEFSYLVALKNISSKVSKNSNFISFNLSDIKEVIHKLEIKIMVDSLISSLKNKDQTFSFNFAKEKMEIMNYLTVKDNLN